MSITVRIALVFACLMTCACAGETQERPAASAGTYVKEPPARDGTTPEPTTHAESRTMPSHDDRFKTRSIGHEGSGDGARRFHGARVDLDLKGAELHDVFRLLADVGKVNIVVAGEVTGTITLKLKQVPWDQALDVIVRAKSLTYEREGNVILVKTVSASAAK